MGVYFKHYHIVPRKRKFTFLLSFELNNAKCRCELLKAPLPPPAKFKRLNILFSSFAEEWETRKKKEITTTRQIETRVKRQVVLEDGEVVEDTGPQVTTNTTEDVEQQEHTTQEVSLRCLVYFSTFPQ